MYYDSHKVQSTHMSSLKECQKEISKFAHPVIWKSIGQMSNSIIPYFALWGVMIYLVRNNFSFWIILPFILMAAILSVRIFIIFHDCCHSSFFVSRRLNTLVGYITGILTFTPFEQWRRSHIQHHATAGDLDRRGSGDIWTMTVEEYRTASGLKRLAYRIVRNPVIMLGLGPVAMFLVLSRFPNKGANKDERRSVLITNLALLAIVLLASWTIGFGTYLAIQLPVILIAGALGIWLFYVQHQFENVYWARHDAWDPVRSALEGSSYYRLPRILQWCTGNIGLHHVHHLRPRIPNYNLQPCYNAFPVLQSVRALSIFRSFKSLWLNLWDEQQQKMVSFHLVKKIASKLNTDSGISVH